MKRNLLIGQIGRVTFEENSKGKSAKSSKFDGEPTQKIILPMNGFKPRPGETWMCEVVHENSSISRNLGAYFVRGMTRVFEIKWPKNFWVDSHIGQELAQDLADGANIMLVGPQGCGKTMLCSVVSQCLGYEFFPIDCTLVRNKLDWFGTRDLDERNGATITVFRVAELALALKAAAEKPDQTFVIFFDELNRCPLEARNALLRIIYGEDRMASLPNGEKITIGDNIQFIAAINEGSGFGGTAGMDAAFADRWSRHKMTYPPAAEEVKILVGKFSQVNQASLELVVKLANVLRERFKAGDITKTVSMRMTENAARRLAGGSTLNRAIISAIVNQYEGDMADPSSEAGQVANIIRGAGVPL